MTNKTQTSDILKYLQSHKRGITSIEAINRFGATRLSDIIFRLRKKGYNIITENNLVKNRYGRQVLVSTYKLEA